MHENRQNKTHINVQKSSMPFIPAAQAAWVLRWNGLLAVAAQRALATTFLELPLHAEPCAAGPAPDLHELLADARSTQRAARSGRVERGTECG